MPKKKSLRDVSKKLAQTLGLSDRKIATYLQEGMSDELARSILKLDGMQEDTEERRKLERESKQLLKSRFGSNEGVSQNLQDLLQEKNAGDFQIDHAREGATKLGKVVVKFKRARSGLNAEEVNEAQHDDVAWLHEYLPTYRTPRMLSPYRKPWKVRVKNPLTNEEELALPQFQEEVKGHDLGTILRLQYLHVLSVGMRKRKRVDEDKSNRTLDVYKVPLTTEQEDRYLGLIAKAFKDTLGFQQRMPPVKSKKGVVLPDITYAIESKIDALIESVEYAKKNTDCELTDGDIAFIKSKAVKDALTEMQPKDTQWYKRKRDASLWNFVIENPVESLTEVNHMEVVPYLKPDNLVHVDNGVGIDHVSIDVHGIGDQFLLATLGLQVPLIGEIFGRGTSENRRKYLREFGYDVPEYDDELMGFLRLPKVRTGIISTYLPKALAKLRKMHATESERSNMIDLFYQELLYDDIIMKEHLRRVKKLERSPQGKAKDGSLEEMVDLIDGVVKRMSSFSMEKVVRDAEKKYR